MGTNNTDWIRVTGGIAIFVIGGFASAAALLRTLTFAIEWLRYDVPPSWGDIGFAGVCCAIGIVSIFALILGGQARQRSRSMGVRR